MADPCIKEDKIRRVCDETEEVHDAVFDPKGGLIVKVTRIEACIESFLDSLKGYVKIFLIFLGILIALESTIQLIIWNKLDAHVTAVVSTPSHTHMPDEIIGGAVKRNGGGQ